MKANKFLYLTVAIFIAVSTISAIRINQLEKRVAGLEANQPKQKVAENFILGGKPIRLGTSNRP
jgi:hypothetical protein